MSWFENLSSQRRSRLVVWSGLFLLVSMLAAASILWRNPDDDSGLFGDNLLLFAIVNLNIVLICVLGFLIGRNLIRLIFDRRRRIMGSALRLRLVTAFLGLSLIPLVFLFILASGLLRTAMQGWFSDQVEQSVSGAVEVARHHYTFLKNSAGSSADRLAREVEAGWSKDNDLAGLQAYLEREREKSQIFSLRVLDSKRQVRASVENAAASIETFREPDPDKEALTKALSGTSSVVSGKREGGQFISAYQPLKLHDGPAVLLLTLRIAPELSNALTQVNDSFAEYQQLKLVKGDIRSGYNLMLTMITGSILFAAIWTGFYIARMIAVPIQRMAEATRKIASGDYSTRVEAGGDDEVGMLAQALNQMTSDLQRSRETSERRKLYLETVLANLAVGVIALDPEGRVTSVNQAAIRIFSIQSVEGWLGKPLQQLIETATFAAIEKLLQAVDQDEAVLSGEKHALETQINLSSQGREIKLVCTVGKVEDENKLRLGTLLLLDDISELVKAQHMAAWREVARRIAHEIKNPLTPIQLSAQRLQKLVGAKGQNPAMDDSVQTIVEHVDSIKRLANEFSHFARMPTAEFKDCDLNMLVTDTIAPYAQSHSDILFQFIAENKLPSLRVDPEQIRRLLINLIENAIDALHKTQEDGLVQSSPRVAIKTSYDRRSKSVSLEIADNGSGIRAADKSRIFEPYFTTKKRGTGLGLAIVTSIVADHQGDIRVYDNNPQGTKFIVELPLAPRESTQRKIASA